jgi:hypothetical protein
MSTITLFKAFVSGMTDYIARHNANYSQIETTINQLLGMVTGQMGGSWQVPDGLKQIFDREGIIGIDSFDFTEGAKTGPAYNIVVSVGAYWDGAANFYSKSSTTTLSMAGKAAGTYYLNLDSAGTPIIESSHGGSCIRSFAWSGSVVSDKALYSGCAVLFDGDDYAACLTSVVRAKDFEQLSDRLEEIEALLSEMGGYYAYVSKTGLNFYYAAGQVRNDADLFETAAGHVACTASVTNYVELNPADGTVSVNQVGFTSGQIPLWEVECSLSTITSFTDRRTWAIAGTGGEGGGGGHTQNTDLGTSSATFTLLRTVAGAPSLDAKLEIERGTSPNVAIRWNESSDVWQYTNNGTDWYNLGDISLDLGSQLLTKYVSIEDPQKVWEEIARSSSEGYEDLDLSTYITAPQGVEAVVLRVFFWDDEPGPMTKVMYKKKDSPYSPTHAFSAWKDEVQPVTLIVPLDSNLIAQFLVQASGIGTANLQVYLVGYFEKVIGVGTQPLSFSVSDLAVPADSSAEFSIDGFLSRGLVHYLKVSETGGLATGVYDIQITKYLPVAGDPDAEDTNYYATNIDPIVPYTDPLPWWYEDEDSGGKLHVKITNHDVAQAMTLSVEIKAEQFA